MDLALGDVDGDGDLDLLVGNNWFLAADVTSQLLLNDGHAHFTDVSATRLPASTGGATPAFADAPR